MQRVAVCLAALLAVAVTAMFLLLSIVPRSGVYATYSVMTGSMAPAIQAGSVAIVVPQDPATIKPGDVITVTSDQPPHATITHRVTRVVPTGHGPEFKTKGDANLLEDPWQFGYNGPAGRVAIAVPWLGYVLSYAGSLWGRMALAGSIGLLVAGFLMPAIWRSRHAQARTELSPLSGAA